MLVLGLQSRGRMDQPEPPLFHSSYILPTVGVLRRGNSSGVGYCQAGVWLGEKWPFQERPSAGSSLPRKGSFWRRPSGPGIGSRCDQSITPQPGASPAALHRGSLP